MWQLIAWPFGKLMWLCNFIFKNYGWALFVFTLIIKLIMLPSSIKTQISSAKMARLNPKIEQLRKKYANNKEKLNEATMELYSQENVNPMGSCLPMLLPFIILFAIVEVVYAPLSYLGNVPKEKLASAQQIVYDVYAVSSAVKSHEASETADSENKDLYEKLLTYKAEEKSSLASYSDDRLKELADILNGDPEMIDYFTDNKKVSSRLLAGGPSTRTQLLVLSVAKKYPYLFDEEVLKLCDDVDYTFLGVDLGAYPSWSSVLVLIPIISLISQLALTVISQYYQKKSGAVSGANKSMNVMLYTMPLISFLIAFSFPAGIGIYWIFSSVLSLVQVVCLNAYYTPQRIEIILEKESKKARKKPSLYQMALEQQKAQLAGQKSAGESALEEALTEDVKLSRAEKKKAERNALNEARRRYAEKYGDSLDDVEDKE